MMPSARRRAPRSIFTRVTARWIARLPEVAFVTRLRPIRLPVEVARQLTLGLSQPNAVRRWPAHSHRACLAIAFFCSFPGRFAGLEIARARGAGKHAGKPQDAETSAEALLGMGLGLHDRVHKGDGGGADSGRFPPHPSRRPLGVSPVCARHVLGDCRVPTTRVRANMARHTSTLVQDLNRGVGDARLE